VNAFPYVATDLFLKMRIAILANCQAALLDVCLVLYPLGHAQEEMSLNQQYVFKIKQLLLRQLFHQRSQQLKHQLLLEVP